MKVWPKIFVCFALALMLYPAAFGATTYVITNDDNAPNSASIYSLDTATGQLTLLKVLPTGGEGNGATFNGFMVAVERTAKCFFVMDAQTDDIAAFSQATGYSKVGNYSNQLLVSTTYGGSIALTPNGKWLYGTYNDSKNVGAWQINSDCSMTFIAAYVPGAGADGFATPGVTPNGLGLVVALPDHGAAELFKINANGSLSDINSVSWAANPTCSQQYCSPLGVDFTKDSKVAVFGNLGEPLLSANLMATGLTNPQVWSVLNEQFDEPVLAILGAGAYAGSGYLYASTFGPDLPGEDPQVTTIDFTESPLNLQAVTTTLIQSPNFIDAQAGVAGNTMIIAELFNSLGVYRINPDGSLTLLDTVIDSNAGALDSFVIYPNTR
jgi:hypothetical protein